jgi:homoaconitase/3-isopropylmalate dehydratase large subunit
VIVIALAECTIMTYALLQLQMPSTPLQFINNTQVFAADAKASYFADHTYDMASLQPVVAMPHSPDNKALARECRQTKIDRVYIGSCTGGKTEDFVVYNVHTMFRLW